MQRKAPIDNKDAVETANVRAIGRMSPCPVFAGLGNARGLAPRNGCLCVRQPRALFHFTKADAPAACRNQIDFPERRARPTGKNAIALEDQPAGGNPLSRAAPPFTATTSHGRCTGGRFSHGYRPQQLQISPRFNFRPISYTRDFSTPSASATCFEACAGEDLSSAALNRSAISASLISAA